MKLLDFVVEEEAGRELPDFVDVEVEDDDEEVADVFSLAEEASPSRTPQVSAVLSSTRFAERDTDGLRALSPGSSMSVSS